MRARMIERKLRISDGMAEREKFSATTRELRRMEVRSPLIREARIFDLFHRRGREK